MSIQSVASYWGPPPATQHIAVASAEEMEEAGKDISKLKIENAAIEEKVHQVEKREGELAASVDNVEHTVRTMVSEVENLKLADGTRRDIERGALTNAQLEAQIKEIKIQLRDTPHERSTLCSIM